MIRAGKLAAHLETVDSWGPTWVINDADIQRLLTPGHPLVEVLPDDQHSPSQIAQGVREGLTTLHTMIRDLDHGVTHALEEHTTRLETALTTRDEMLRTELAALRAELARLREQMATPPRRSWWPWGKHRA